jgi:hypothetical protein
MATWDCDDFGVLGEAATLPLRGEGPVITFEGKRVKSVRTACWRKGRERAGFDDTVTLYS